MGGVRINFHRTCTYDPHTDILLKGSTWTVSETAKNQTRNIMVWQILFMCGWQVKLCDLLVTHGPYLSVLAVILPIIKGYTNSQITLTLVRPLGYCRAALVNTFIFQQQDSRIDRIIRN